MKRLMICAGALIVLGAIAFLLVWQGVILLNNPSKDRYPVRGVDVSAYQGEIDWRALSAQGIQFAFIKATEGSSFVDSRFMYNYAEALNTPLRVGAYHFFSFDSPGDTQADNYISAVARADGMLPPVVDFEFYGDKAKNMPEKRGVLMELDALLIRLEAHYGVKPIIYATEKSYAAYLSGNYQDYDIWIRNVISAPALADGREWTFWQYTNRERLDGYQGFEKFIDMNVFYGSVEEFENYAR